MENTNEEIFNPDYLDCCIEIGDCELQNPSKELIDKLKEKLVVKFQRRIGFRTKNDNR